MGQWQQNQIQPNTQTKCLNVHSHNFAHMLLLQYEAVTYAENIGESFEISLSGNSKVEMHFHKNMQM